MDILKLLVRPGSHLQILKCPSQKTVNLLLDTIPQKVYLKNLVHSFIECKLIVSTRTE